MSDRATGDAFLHGILAGLLFGLMGGLMVATVIDATVDEKRVKWDGFACVLVSDATGPGFSNVCVQGKEIPALLKAREAK